MKWKLDFDRKAYRKLFRFKKSLPLNAELVMLDAMECGVVQKIISDMKDEPLPHRIRIYNPDHNFTIISEVNYKSREVIIVDVKHGDKRFE